MKGGPGPQPFPEKNRSQVFRPVLSGTSVLQAWVESGQSHSVLPPETGEQPSLSSGLSDAPWLYRRRPGSLCIIIEYSATIGRNRDPSGRLARYRLRLSSVCLLLQYLLQSCNGGHVLRETTSRGLCGLVCPSRTKRTRGIPHCNLPQNQIVLKCLKLNSTPCGRFGKVNVSRNPK